MDNLILPDDSRPTRSDAVKNHALLLETAQRLFNAHGLEHVSMTTIAEEAGVGKGTLYRHFKNKADLAHALLDQDMFDLQERVLRRLRNQGTVEDDLEWVLEQFVRFVARNQALLCVAAREEGILGSEAHLWWRQTLRGLLFRAGVRNELDYLTDVLYVMLDVRTLRFQLQALGYNLEQILTGLHTTARLILP
jgi:AcrR family transcriptional regulator